jgi:hypothetical protein
MLLAGWCHHLTICGRAACRRQYGGAGDEDWEPDTCEERGAHRLGQRLLHRHAQLGNRCFFILSIGRQLST